MPRRRKAPKPPAAHIAPPPAPAPELLPAPSLMMRLEREVEAEFGPLMLRSLGDKIAAEQAAMVGHAPVCDGGCGRKMESKGRESRTFRCKFGELTSCVPIYRCKRCKRTACPLWTRLGVEAGRFTGALARHIALLGTLVSYELASRLCAELLDVEVCPMTVWREVQRLGAACEAYQQQSMRHYNDPRREPARGEATSAAPEPPEVVVIGTDGCVLGMQVRDKRRRRKPGQKKLPPLAPVEEGQFREVKTGVLLLPTERVEPSPGRRSVVRRVLVTCLGNADELFARLSAKLVELNWLGPKTVIVIVGDGAEWIWNRAKLFANRCEILDFWHAVEKAWEFARVQYGAESRRGEQFMDRLARDLRAGGVDGVLARLGRLKPTSPEAKERLDTLIKYYTDNRSRMRYDEYLRRGYGIGSGAVESAHKQVVHARFRQAGMRFSERGARNLLALRVLLRSGEWSLLDRLAMKPIAAAAA